MNISFPGPHSRATIVLVEDEDLIRALFRNVLRTGGYTVLAAGTAEEALDAAAAHRGPIHALVTDLSLPGLNGYQLAARLGSRYPGLQVLYLSGTLSDRPGAALVQGHAFLLKPFPLDTLVAKVGELLERQRTGAG